MEKLRLKHLKVFGLLLSMFVMCIAAFIPTETVQAKNIKNKTFVIKSDYPININFLAVEDDNAANKHGGWNDCGLGTISCSAYDWNNHSYTVTMSNVDVTDWTPYMEIMAAPNQSHYPKSITPTKWGGNGMNHGTHEVHNLQDISGYPDYRLMYIGLGYTADEIQVDFGEYRWYATYDLNGGQGNSSTQSALRGSNICTHGTPTRHGYTFTHYHYNYNGEHDVNASSALGAGNWDTTNITGPTINLVAQWSPNPYTISYNSNKPSKASNSVTGSTGQTNLVYDQTGNLANNGFSLKGWSFVSWNTKADGSGTTYQAGQQVKNMNDGQNTTLYAQWKPNTYTLTLDDQYAVKAGTTAIYEKYDYGWYEESTAQNSAIIVDIPEKTGKKFGGYYTRKNGEGEQWIDANGKLTSNLTNNKISTSTTIYAKWTPAVYKITLDNQGADKVAGTAAVWEKHGTGYFSDAAATKQYTNSNKKITCPQKKNYTFGGYWTVKNDYNQSNGQQLINENGEINIAANTLFEKDSTVYARWIPNTYKINLDNQGADIDKGTSAYYEKYGILNYTSLADYDVNTGIATLKYDYTGSTQTFTAPADGDYTLEVAGAQGGDHPATPKENATSVGGQGGISKGNIHLKAGETLYIEVGNKPSGYNGSYNGSDTGWTGGAESGIYVGGSCVAGGGATDIRKGGNGIDNRVIVAGGGGGATFYARKAVDGAAGGGAETGTVKYITEISNDSGNIYTTINKGANQTGHFNFTQYERHSSNKGGGCLSNPHSGTSYGFILYREAKAQNKGFYNGGGGYWGGAYMYGDCVMSGGLGGSGYIGGVTNGSMTNGGNKGNGWAKISYNAKELGQHSVVEKYFNYTGDVQTFTAPVDGEYTLEVGGAQGGAADYAKGLGLSGGKGGVSTGKVTLKKGEVLNIYVGQKGAPTQHAYNGGGRGVVLCSTTDKFYRDRRTDGGGGGATDIRKDGTGLNNRIIVAGGGGGATTYGCHGVNGGDGGGTTAGALKWVAWYGGFDSNGIANTHTGNSQICSASQTFSVDPEAFKKAILTSYISETDDSTHGTVYIPGSFGQGGYNSGGGYYGGTKYVGTVKDLGSKENTTGKDAAYAMYCGGGGSGYTGGVTDGLMQNGVNEGNGYAKITYVNTDISNSSACSIRIPQKSGYTFDGYLTGRNQTGEEVVDATGAVCSSVTKFNDDNTDSNRQTTVYAHWTNNEYSVIYKSNYTNPETGEVIGSPDSQYRDRVTYGSSYQVKDNMFNAPSGYKFKKWNTKPDGTGETWTVGESNKYSKTFSTTLYAIWEPDANQYTEKHYIEDKNGKITKDGIKFTEYSSEVKTNNIKTGSKIKVTAKSITGYKFVSTMTDCNSSAGTDANGYTTIKVTADGKAYVNYYYTKKDYTLTIRKGSGITSVSGAGENGTIQVKYNDEVNIDAVVDSDNGYSWSGWTETANKTSVTTTKEYHFKMPAKNLDYTANANQNQKFTLTVIPLAKKDSSTTSTSATWYDPVSKTTKTANKGTKITFTLNYNGTLAIANPERTSFNYEGWKMYESGTYNEEKNTGTEIVPGKGNSYIDSNGVFHMGNKNTTIVAQWNVISAKYQVNYWFQKADGNPDGKLADNYSKDVEWSYTAYADADSKVSPKVYTLIDCAKETSDNAEKKAVNDLKEKLYGFYAPDMVTETVKANGTTVIDYKYTRSKINLKYNAGSDPNGNKASVKASGYKTDANGNIQKSDGTDVTTAMTYGATNLKTADAGTFNLSLTGYSLDKRQTWVNKTLGLYLSGNQTMMPSEIMAVQGVIDKKFESEAISYRNTLDSRIIVDKHWTRSYWNGLSYAQRNYYRNKYMLDTANNKLSVQTMNSDIKDTLNNSSVVLSANWEANSYNVTLNFDGATTKPTSGTPMGDASTIAADGNSATWNSYVQYDHAIPKVFGSDKIAKTGYTFAGWKNGDILWNTDGTVVKGKKLNNSTWSDANGLYKYTGNTTVTAQWKENTYSIEFKANKPSRASHNVSGDFNTITNVKYTQSITLKSAPSLTGWTFKGWNTQADGKGTSYSTGQSVSKLSATNGATVKLYAIWAENQLTINFHKNKPKTASNDVTGNFNSYKQGYEDSVVINRTPTLAGWTFKGWNTQADGKGTNYTGKTVTKVDGTINLYAQWKENTFTINFHPNKPSRASHDVTGDFSSVTQGYESSYTVNRTPTLTGWTFKGWNTQADGKGTDYTGKNVTKTDKTINLYAQWSENSYNIVFHGNTPVKPVKASSTVTGSVAAKTKVMYEDKFNLPKVTGTKGAFALTGWKFAGWSRLDTDKNGNNNGLSIDYKDGAEVQGLSATNGATVNLYAQWDANKYKIHFDKNKPSTSNGYDKDSVASHDVTGEMADIEHVYDIEKALPDNKFALHGWKFKGWNTQADGKGTAFPNKGKVLNLTTVDNATVTLYAQWEATTYTITFDSNKHPKAVTNMTGAMANQVLTYDKWENLHENKYKLEGWTFDKWNLKADGSSATSYKDKERVRNICDGKDTTLYAQWKDTTPPDASKTYLRATKSGNVNDSDYARALAVATVGSRDVTTSTSVTRTLDGLGNRTWSTNWINNKVSLDLYSYDNGSGIKLLTTYSGSNEWNKTKFDPSENTKQVKSSKYDESEGTEVFHGIATDNSKKYYPAGEDNSIKTRNLTVKIDMTAPNTANGFTVKTGTLKNALCSQFDVLKGWTTNKSINTDANGKITGANEDGLRTEMAVTVSDKKGDSTDVSGVKYVWAVVSDMENSSVTKTYECIRVKGDAYDGTYVAVDGSGKMPNLYKDFAGSKELRVRMFAVDEAGNNRELKVKGNDNDRIIINISVYSRVERDDANQPDTTPFMTLGSSEGPKFMLNQSGKVKVVTYGYVDAVDIDFPKKMQEAAKIDTDRGQSVKNLGTIAHFTGAYVDGRINFTSDSPAVKNSPDGGCTRIYDYPFIVPLYLSDPSIGLLTKADGWSSENLVYKDTLISTREIARKGHETVNSTASFYCGTDGSVTDRLRTHLVN